VANHAGSVQFRVCRVTKENEDPKMSCFDEKILKFENGQDKFKLNDAVMSKESVYDLEGNVVGLERWHTYKVKLPNNLECKHCLFQVNNKQIHFSHFLK
jgi:hypothetical protein